MQTLAKERSRIDNIRKVVRRREHTGLEAGRDASGPAAEVEDANGAVAVARLDEPPRFPMDGFVGGGLRLELVSSFDCVRVSLWCLAAGKVVRFPTSLHFLRFCRHFQTVGLPAACATSQVQTACVGSSNSERPVGPLNMGLTERRTNTNQVICQCFGIY